MTKEDAIQYRKNKALNDIKKIYSPEFNEYEFSNYDDEDGGIQGLSKQRDIMIRNIIYDLEQDIEKIKVNFKKKGY